jgi:hypothetical protein
MLCTAGLHLPFKLSNHNEPQMDHTAHIQVKNKFYSEVHKSVILHIIINSYKFKIAC